MADTTIRYATFGGQVICEYDANLANGRVSRVRVINESQHALRAIVRNAGVIAFDVTAPAGQTSVFPIAGMTIGMEEPDPEFPDETLGIDLGPYALQTVWPA